MVVAFALIRGDIENTTEPVLVRMHSHCVMGAEGVGLKKRLVREITAPFIAHQKSIRDLVVERRRSLLQSLVHAAEQSPRIGQIFRPTGECDTRRNLITRIRGTTRDFTLRR